MRLSVSLVVLASLIACRTNRDSFLKHELNQPLNDQGAWQWIDIDLSSYVKFAEVYGRLNLKAQALDSPQTQFVEALIREIDDKLRAKYPEKLDPVPKPKAFVVDDDSINAFVGSYPICFSNVALRFENDSTARKFAFAATAQRDGTVQSLPLSSSACTTVANEELLNLIIDAINRESLSCKVKLRVVSDVFEVLAAPSCLALGEMAYRSGGKHFSYLPTATWISVNSGAVSNLNSAELLGIIAHELAHYYKAHGFGSERKYNFFYDFKGHDRLSAPLPVEETHPESANILNEFKDDRSNFIGMRSIVTFLNDFRFDRRKFPEYPTYLHQIRGQQIHSALCSAIHGNLKRLSASSCTGKDKINCISRCEPLKEKFASLKCPSGRLTSQELDNYLLWEKEASQCMQTLTAKQFDGINDYKIKFNLARFSDLMQQISWPKNAWDFYQRLSEAIESKYPFDPFWAAVYSDYLDIQKLEGRLEKISDKLWNRYLLPARGKHWGYFTEEQEADELAIEWMILFDKDASKYLDALKKLTEDGSKETCKSLIKANFLDEQGNPAAPPLGGDTLTHPHHDYCFRLASAVHELRAIQANAADSRER